MPLSADTAVSYTTDVDFNFNFVEIQVLNFKVMQAYGVKFSLTQQYDKEFACNCLDKKFNKLPCVTSNKSINSLLSCFNMRCLIHSAMMMLFLKLSANSEKKNISNIINFFCGCTGFWLRLQTPVKIRPFFSKSGSNPVPFIILAGFSRIREKVQCYLTMRFD